MNTLPTATQQKIFNRLLNKPENLKCADCSSKSPSWASIDFGVFVCLNCSGAHRALGPSVTRVRSTKLDAWVPGLTDFLELGNQVCNQYWQNNIGAAKKPNANSSLEEIKKFVLEKYIKKKYALTGKLDPVSQLKANRANGVNRQTKNSTPIVKQEAPKVSSTKSVPVKSQQADILGFEEDDFVEVPISDPVSKASNKTISKNSTPSGLDLLDFSEPVSQPSSHPVNASLHPGKKDLTMFHSLSSHPAPSAVPSYQNIYHNNMYPHQHQQLSFNSMYPGTAAHQHYNHNMYNTGAHFDSHGLNHLHVKPQSLSMQPQVSNTGFLPFHQQNHHQQQQPLLMNMNINMNMYANNMNFTLQPTPAAVTTADKKDLFHGFDQFKF